MSDSQDPFATPPEIGSEPAAGPPPGEPSQDDINLALISHLSGLIGIAAAGWVGFVGPLVVYLMKKDSSAFVESQAKEALNFQITMLLLSAICAIVTAASCGFLFPVVFLPPLLQLIFGIIAALAVRDGKPYRYPYTLRLIR